jgi:hypothetical protein
MKVRMPTAVEIFAEWMPEKRKDVIEIVFRMMLPAFRETINFHSEEMPCGLVLSDLRGPKVQKIGVGRDPALFRELAESGIWRKLPIFDRPFDELIARGWVAER